MLKFIQVSNFKYEDVHHAKALYLLIPLPLLSIIILLLLLFHLLLLPQAQQTMRSMGAVLSAFSILVSALLLLAANDFTGIGANNRLVWTADATNGGFIQRIRAKPGRGPGAPGPNRSECPRAKPGRQDSD